MRASRFLSLLPFLGLLLPLSAGADQTLYSRLGGQAGVSRIVDGLMLLCFNDPRLKADFDNINPDRLRTRIGMYVCQVSDGPCTYNGRAMSAAHKGLHIDQARFNAVVENLQTAMDRADVPFWTQNQLLARLAPMQRDIITR